MSIYKQLASNEITIEARKKATKDIVNHLLKKYPTDKAELVKETYNSALDDVFEAIDTYTQNSMEYYVPFSRLKKSLESWMPLID